MKNNKLVSTGLGVVVLLVGTVGGSVLTHSASAKSVTPSTSVHTSPIDRQARHAKVQAKFDAQLSQYVKDGKITDAQKQLILSKKQEIQANRLANKNAGKNLTPTDRKIQMQANRKELEAWATQNGIDIQYLMPHGGIRAGWNGK